MASKISKFKEAYATMTVAVYEPLVLKWISEWGLREIASVNVKRAPIAETIKAKNIPTAGEIAFHIPKVPGPQGPPGGQPPPIDPVGPIDNGPIMGGPGGLGPTPFPRPEGGVISGGGPINVNPGGLEIRAERPLSARINSTAISATALAAKSAALVAAPTVLVKEDSVTTLSMNALSEDEPDYDFQVERDHLFTQLKSKTLESLEQRKPLGQMLQKLETSKKKSYFGFLPAHGVEEVLSPIGIANFYRQLYYYVDEGYGPIEQCFTVAPKESLTVVIQSARKQIKEEFIELGSESVSEQAVEERNQYEVSDKVTSMLQRDLSASMSTSASYTVPVFQATAQASFSMSTSQQRGKETATRRLKDVTKRASERITKSYTITTKNYEEFSEMEETTRVLSNLEDQPVNYALRRIFNRIKVKIQDVGPKLVWQLHIRDPGRGLRTSKFVHFMDASEIPPQPDIPLDIPPKPKGGIETGQTQVAIFRQAGQDYINIRLKEIEGRKIVTFQVDSMKDLSEPGGKEDDKTPAPYSNSLHGSWNPSTREFTGRLKVRRGNSNNVGITYTYRWEPDEQALADWESKKKQATHTDEAKRRIEEFENKKALITEYSKVKPRPSSELRKEERYEILGRMIGHLFGNSKNPAYPNPKEIEFFHRFFDVEALFVYHHPSWWKPRRNVLSEDDKYPITAESEPAKLGASLGWRMQLDGDNRRNEFLNSAWVRVCLPLKPGRERQAVEWLATHVEGKLGFNIEEGPLAELLQNIETYRESEQKLGTRNEDYITVDHTVGAPDTALKPENVYPVIDEFTVTVPTEGFIYDKIEI